MAMGTSGAEAHVQTQFLLLGSATQRANLGHTASR